MDQNKHHLYFNLEKHERDAVVGYLLDALLHARQSCHIPSNDKSFDEDVNVYLAHLLLATSLPDYQELTKRYLSLNSSDLMENIDHHNDKVIRYFIYKVNADYLLVHLGIFNDLTSEFLRPFQKSERQFISMGQSYYDSALQYNHQIYRKRTAIGDVLGKLSQNFADYKLILQAVRDEFFRLQKKIGTETKSGEKKLKKVVYTLALEQKQNEFLDVYGEWLKTRSSELVVRLRALVDEIKKMDPEFGFNVDSIVHPE